MPLQKARLSINEQFVAVIADVSVAPGASAAGLAGALRER